MSGHVRINLGSFAAFMAQQFLDVSQAYARFKQVGSVTVS